MTYPEDFDDLLPANKTEFCSLPPRIQVARCIHMLEAQVNNGGFHQFFFNSSGEYVPETLAALGQIGALKTRNLLSRAVAAAYPMGYPPDTAKHRASLASIDDVASPLELIDAEFFRYDEPLDELVNAYLTVKV